MHIVIDETTRARIDAYKGQAAEPEWIFRWGDIVTDEDVINLALRALDSEVECRRLCARLDKHPMYHYGGEDEYY